MVKPYSLKNFRKSQYPINSIFTKRWSPRSMSGEKITKKELLSLFEAARWAPSSSNIQPWRFIYGLKGSKEFEKLFSLLDDFNVLWCKNASALVLIISYNKKPKNGKFNPLHSFDTGSAWMSLALQARMDGLIAHGMAGFDYSKARKLFKIPKDYSVEAMIAIGKQGEIKDLHERMQKSEKPNSRKKVEEFVGEGVLRK